MQLLQALFDSENELLFTGDKRFLSALANVGSLDEKLERVSGRFICFEQIIYFLIVNLGFEQVKAKFIQALQAQIKVDASLKFCFEGQCHAIEENVIKNLRTHIDYLRKESSKLLADSEKWLPPYSDIDLAR